MAFSPGRVAERLVGDAYGESPVQSLRDLRHAVERGLEVEALERITDYLGRDAAEAARLRHAIVPRTTLRRRTRLTTEESERTERMARLVVMAEETWEDRESAREFLLSPQPQLGGDRPVVLALTELGAREVEELLARLEYSLPA
jgi:putative toxin-antitoxin system antitoxin component (TIGR02293 family)